MKKTLGMTIVSGGLLSLVTNLGLAHSSPPASPVGHFAPAATYTVSGEVAEIVAATPDGQTLLYTDSASQEVGFVDISDPDSGPLS